MCVVLQAKKHLVPALIWLDMGQKYILPHYKRIVMNQEIVAIWVRALRSGEYQQGFKQLRADVEGNTYCVLGVQGIQRGLNG